MAMAQAMGQTAKTMGAMNQAVKLQDMQHSMMDFEKQSTHMAMAEELSKGTELVMNFSLPFCSYC